MCVYGGGIYRLHYSDQVTLKTSDSSKIVISLSHNSLKLAREFKIEILLHKVLGGFKL